MHHERDYYLGLCTIVGIIYGGIREYNCLIHGLSRRGRSRWGVCVYHRGRNVLLVLEYIAHIQSALPVTLELPLSFDNNSVAFGCLRLTDVV